MIAKKLQDKKLILASKSPRRQDLLRGLGIDFEIVTKDVEEIYPDHLKREQVPIYLAELKAKAFENDIEENTIIITSDTTVLLDDDILNKPKDIEEAEQMLKRLSGRTHSVVTGVCLTSKDKQHSFYSETKVVFKTLDQEEISYYLKHFSPLDKAGSYGIQEWIGYIGIEKIEGCFFNVMGLPLNKLYKELEAFLND